MDKTVQRAYSLADIATILEIVAMLLMIGGVVAGCLVLAQRQTDAEIGAGIAIIAYTAAVGTILWVLARSSRLFGEYVADRLTEQTADDGNGVWLDERPGTDDPQSG